MEAPFLRLLDRYLVWLVALLASLEAFGAAARGVADRRTDHAVIWLIVPTAIIDGTSLLEIELDCGDSGPHLAAPDRRLSRGRASFRENQTGLMVE